MSFRCPECAAPNSLTIVRSIELPPDSRSDEIALQIVECVGCGFAGIAVYQESRRGALGDESVDHTGYVVSSSDLKAVRDTMARCPNPRNRRCRCAAHRALGKRDPTGRWDGLADVRFQRGFPMEL